MSERVKIKALIGLSVGRQKVVAGETVLLDKEIAKRFCDRNMATLVNGDKKPRSMKAKQAAIPDAKADMTGDAAKGGQTGN